MSGLKRRLKTHHEKKPLPQGWIVVPSKSFPDRVFFYNTITKCSTWKNPCEDINDKTQGDSLSEASYTGRKKSFGSESKLSKTSRSKKHKSKTILPSSEINLKLTVNHEIEDYDEQQGQYFDNISINAFSLTNSNIISCSNNLNSTSSSKTNNSDSGKQSQLNILLKDNNKQPSVHFVSNPEKFCTKKSTAICDLNASSTNKYLELKMTQGTEKNNSLYKDLSEDKGHDHLDLESFNESTCCNYLKSKIRKRKKKKRSSRNIKEKVVKNTRFKKHDKTPAQTGLLQLRKQNAEKLKEFAAKNPDFAVTKKKIVKDNSSSKYSSIFNAKGQTEVDSFNETYLKNKELCSSVAQEAGCHSEVDYSEEMDWEPSNEETDVKNINLFRQQLDKANEVPQESFFGINLDHSSALPSKAQSWFLVLDTNIFVSCLNFVKELRDTKVSDLGYPIIYVPWRVLQELDHLKDTKIDTVNKHLHANVRKAIAYLNDNFKSRHPRIFGQSFEDFASIVDEVSAPDDEILQTCIKFQKQHANKLVLLTNDKNLESKAIVSGIEVYSKERFKKKYLNSESVSPSFNNVLNTSGNRGDKNDVCLCEVKTILKEFLSFVVETEMKIAFEGDWIKLAFKKPPWTLQDALDCLLKHWRSVFFLNFSKETQSEAEKLYGKLFKTVSVNTEDVTEIIRTTLHLILSIKRSQKEKRPYVDLISATMTRLSNLLEKLSPNHSQVVSATGTSLISSVSNMNDSFCHTQRAVQNEVPSTDVLKVKTLFKDIWDFLKSFCCSISDVINSSAPRNDTIIQEIRLKLSQTLNQVEEFVTMIEKILQINPEDVCDRHFLIIHFSNFLIRLYPTMAPDIKKELPESLVAFFTDFEGRSLLSTSLKDFKEFIWELSKAAEYFSTPTFGSNFLC